MLQIQYILPYPAHQVQVSTHTHKLRPTNTATHIKCTPLTSHQAVPYLCIVREFVQQSREITLVEGSMLCCGSRPASADVQEPPVSITHCLQQDGRSSVGVTVGSATLG